MDACIHKMTISTKNNLTKKLLFINLSCDSDWVFSFENNTGITVAVNTVSYNAMLQNFFLSELDGPK